MYNTNLSALNEHSVFRSANRTKLACIEKENEVRRTKNFLNREAEKPFPLLASLSEGLFSMRRNFSSRCWCFFFNSRHWGKKEAKCLPDDHPRSKQAKSTACLRIERNGITIVKVETLARFCSIWSWGNFACTRNSELVSVRREHSNRAFESRRIDHGRSFHR